MADGAYERRQGREAELKRFARIIAEARKSADKNPAEPDSSHGSHPASSCFMVKYVHDERSEHVP